MQYSSFGCFVSLHPESGILLFVVRKTHKCVFIMFLGSPTLGSVVNLTMNVHGNYLVSICIWFLFATVVICILQLEDKCFHMV